MRPAGADAADAATRPRPAGPPVSRLLRPPTTGQAAPPRRIGDSFCAKFTDCDDPAPICWLRALKVTSPWICAAAPGHPCPGKQQGFKQQGFSCESDIDFVTCKCGKAKKVDCVRQHVVPIGEAGSVIPETVCAVDLAEAAARAAAAAKDEAETFGKGFCANFACPGTKSCDLDDSKVGVGVDECRPPVIEPGCGPGERGFTCDVRVATMKCACV